MNQSSSLGFVIGRYISSPVHVDLCFRAHASVRRHYPNNPIVIVDDNSLIPDPHHYDSHTTVMHSEFRGAGEFGLYYYYYTTQLFDRAVLIHDSMVIKKALDLPAVPIMYLWHFPHHVALDLVAEDIKALLGELDDKDTIEAKYKSNDWLGMYGCSAALTWDCLDRVARRHQLFRLLPKVNTRMKRCAMERVLGVLFNDYLERNKPSLNGNIFDLPGADFVRRELLTNYEGYMDKTWHGR